MSLAAADLNAFRYSPFHSLVYVKNQKAACTSIEYSLWKDYDRKTGRRTFRGRTHDRRTPILGGPGPLIALQQERLCELQVFTAVRNPFSRILSAYLHHVFDGDLRSRVTRRLGLWRSALIRRQFFEGAGLNPSESLSFDDFVECLIATPAGRLTGHFRPQVMNVYWNSLRYDFVGRLEEPGALHRFFAARQVVFRKRAPHAQSAGRQLAVHYSQRTVEDIGQHFALDFAAFGYDPGDPFAAPLRAIADQLDALPLGGFLDRHCNCPKAVN